MNRGEAMREARKKAGMTMRQLAAISGVSHPEIGYLERGEINGKIDTIELLADALGLSIDEYVGHRRKDNGRDVCEVRG